MNKLTQAISLVLLLSGCTLAPKYQTPDVSLSEQWISVALKKQQKDKTISVVNLGWKDYYLDQYLQGLISNALAYNHDLRKAALNIELAQAQYQITESDRLPSVNASAKSERTRTRDNYSVGLGVASFELDFFGRIKNLSEKALDDYLATKEAYDAAQLSLINSVAKAYYKWRIDDGLRNLAQRTLNTRRKTYKLTQLRLKEGVASGLDLSSARSAIAGAESSYQKQARATKQSANALALIVGKPLASLNLGKKNTLTRQFPNKKLFVGIPSDTLISRPDIRQAEYALMGANANIGAARARLFPSIRLTGNLGYASNEMNGLLSSANQVWAISPSIDMPIFDYGKRKSNVKIAETQQKILVQNYQKIVQSAFFDVDNALIARKTLAKQFRAERNAQAAANQTLKLVKLKVSEGISDGLQLLDAERNSFYASQNVFRTRQLLLNNRVDLFTALGGGLEESQSGKTVWRTPKTTGIKK